VRRLVILLVAVVATLAPVVLTVTPAAAQTDPATAEAEFVARINDLRASKGLGQLTVDPELVRVARAWSEKMAAADQISHNPNLAKEVAADWQKLGENVGVGMTVAKLHEAFVKSPAHYRNLVDPDFTHIGVAVVIGRDGALFTTHQFMKLRPRAAAAAAATAAPPATTSTTARPRVTEVAGTEVAAAPPAPAVAPAPSGRLVLVLEQLRALDQR
jgi:hypothetical protein